MGKGKKKNSPAKKQDQSSQAGPSQASAQPQGGLTPSREGGPIQAGTRPAGQPGTSELRPRQAQPQPGPQARPGDHPWGITPAREPQGRPIQAGARPAGQPGTSQLGPRQVPPQPTGSKQPQVRPGDQPRQQQGFTPAREPQGAPSQAGARPEGQPGTSQMGPKQAQPQSGPQVRPGDHPMGFAPAMEPPTREMSEMSLRQAPSQLQAQASWSSRVQGGTQGPPKPQVTVEVEPRKVLEPSRLQVTTNGFRLG